MVNDRHWCPGHHDASEALGLFFFFANGNQLVHEADPVSLFRIDEFSGQHQFSCLIQTHNHGQQFCRASGNRHTGVALWKTKDSIFSSNNHVGVN